MKLLAIDPSSTLTGYAVMADRSTIIEAGLLRPQKDRDPAIMRIEAMANGLAELIESTEPEHILIEIPSAKSAERIKRKSLGAGLAIYGFAAGAMWWQCFSMNVAPVTAIDAELWTGGVPKLKRQQNVCMAFQNRYDPEADKGGDIADAIGLAWWWFSKQKAKRIAG